MGNVKLEELVSSAAKEKLLLDGYNENSSDYLDGILTVMDIINHNSSCGYIPLNVRDLIFDEVLSSVRKKELLDRARETDQIEAIGLGDDDYEEIKV